MSDWFRGRNVLITGGLGFIGSNLAIELVRAGANLTLVDSMIPSYGASLDNIAEIRELVRLNFSDVRDLHSLRYLVRNQDVIFSLAGQVSHIDSMTDPLTDLDINCRSNLSLLECCRNENPSVRLVLAGTRQIYGKPQFLPVTESHPHSPADVNGVNKLAAEMYFKLYHQVYGMHTVSLRLTNTYGARMDLRNQHKGFVGVFLRRALAGLPLQVFGSGAQRRDFNHVDDVSRALLLAAECDQAAGESFNLGHHAHYSLREFVELLRKYLQFDFQCVPFPPDRQAIDIGDYYGDYSKFSQSTGWRPLISLHDGLRDTIEFFRSRTSYWQ